MGTPASESGAGRVAVRGGVGPRDASRRAIAQHPDALAALAWAYGLDGRFEDGAELLTSLWRRRGELAGRPSVVCRSPGLLCLFLLALGRDEELDAVLVEAGAVADAARAELGPGGGRPRRDLLRLVQGRRSYQRGELPCARSSSRLASALAELAGRPTYVVLGLVFLADLELATGRRSDARATLVRAREIVDNDPVTPFVRGWLDEAETRIGRVAVRAAADQGALFEELTDRELSILRMLPGTATQREIGQRCSSRSTRSRPTTRASTASSTSEAGRTRSGWPGD